MQRVVNAVYNDDPFKAERGDMPALIWAVANENEEIVEKLLENGASVSEKYEGKTALFLAVEKDNE